NGYSGSQTASLADSSIMQNRRQDYRFAFPTSERREGTCRFNGAGSNGELIDVSVTGARVRLHDPHGQGASVSHSLAPGQRVEVQLNLGPDKDVELPALVIHRIQGEPEVGLRFLSLADLRVQEERERALWTFLLDQQRRVRRQVKAG